MKKMFQTMWLLGVLVLIAACGDHSRFKYESVPGDPLNARIYTLDNGLKVYMTVNKDQPRIQTYVAVRAGGKNDPAETTGLAHYFEHLMFKGTDSFGTQNYEQEKPMLDRIEALFEVYRKTTDEAQRTALYRQIDSVSYEASKIAIPNEYDKLMAAIGATGTNAYTSYDQTVFEENCGYLPKALTEKIKHVKDHMLQNEDGRISLKELAAEHEISLTQLKAGFKQIYGETPYAYLRSYKMHCASQRLLETDLQIGEIALELGYQNPSKFAQAFRAIVGCTPAQYRSGRKNK